MIDLARPIPFQRWDVIQRGSHSESAIQQHELLKHFIHIFRSLLIQSFKFSGQFIDIGNKSLLKGLCPQQFEN